MTRHRTARVCDVVGCGRPHEGRGYCAPHLARLQRLGDVHADLPIGFRSAGGGSYGGVRARLRAERGPATGHACAECGAPARCWSYDGTDPAERREPTRDLPYSLDLHRYRPRCLSCHRQATNRPWRTAEARAAIRARESAWQTQPDAGCAVPGCEGRHDGRGYCHTHLSRLQRLGDAHADVPIQHKRTHGKVSYWSVHERLRAEAGAPGERACDDCGRPAWCWSYIGGDPDERTDPSSDYRYSLDLDRYRPRCRSCHRKATVARNPPREQSPVPDIERAVWLYERGVSAAGIGALMDVSRTAVLAALRAQGVTIRGPGSFAPVGNPHSEAPGTEGVNVEDEDAAS